MGTTGVEGGLNESRLRKGSFILAMHTIQDGRVEEIIKV
jgi:hypothetical protein